MGELNYTDVGAHITWDSADTSHPSGCTFKIDDRQGHFNPGLNGAANPNFLNICMMNTTAEKTTMVPTTSATENMTTAAPSPSSPSSPSPSPSSPSPSSPSPSDSSETAGAAVLIPSMGVVLVAAISAVTSF